MAANSGSQSAVPSLPSPPAPPSHLAPYGFSFSAGGLLFSYYIGIAAGLRDAGVLLPETPVAGASAGSLIAACCKSGLPTDTIVAAFDDLALDCRTHGTRLRLGPVLERVLTYALPEDIHARCEGVLHVAVTRVFPNYGPLTISSFSSKQDVINTLLTSCHIPFFFNGNLVRAYRDAHYYDGGLTQFLPKPPAARVFNVCCFPAANMRGAGGSIDISPDTFEPWPYTTRQMLAWAFEPAPEEILVMLTAKGRRDAMAWAESQGGLAGLLSADQVLANPTQTEAKTLVL
ncbi:MAG: hypothetical protein WDW36_008994 [Sanguina aurantia]